jgi:AraC-like DNA-binding protein
MRYVEIKPAVQLARFIECYWTLESDGSAASSPQTEPILPDGCVELIFNFGAQFVEHYDGKVIRQPVSFLVGQMTRPMLIAPTGFVCVVGVRFHPGGTLPFFRLPMHELTDATVELCVVSNYLERRLFERVGQESSLLQKVRAVETCLNECVRNSRQDSWILGLAAKIVSEAGLISVDTLASSTGISSRQLERRFLQEVGVTPKLLCRILRFQRIFRSIDENDGRWATAAADCGYYDQSHLIRDFKQFAGETPSVFLDQPGLLTEAFTRKDRMSHFSNILPGKLS